MIAARGPVRRTPIALHGGRFALEQSSADVAASYHDFSVSLNAFGPAPIVRSAVASAAFDEYPDPLNRAARKAVSERWGRPVSEITIGAGAAELIHATCFAYLRRGDVTLVSMPAFAEYARAASLCAGQAELVSADGTAPDLAALHAEIDRCHPRLVFLASPVSPTGEALARDVLGSLADVCRQADALLVLDQSYDGLATCPLGTPAVPGHSHVLHIRSLTKDHGLAGLRVAIAVGPRPIVASLDRARIPWVVSSLAQAAVVAVLSEEAVQYVANTGALLRAEALRIVHRCAALGLPHSATATHFLAIRTGDGRATRASLLADFGLLVRDCTSFGMREWIRVAARTHEETSVLLDALGPMTAPSLPRSSEGRDI
jgi:histidinol-phosphate aminotransferase